MKKIVAIVCGILFVFSSSVWAAPEVKNLQAIIQQGSALIGLNAPTWIDTRVLAAGVAEVHTVPTGAKYVLFSATTNFYANYGAAAAVPTDDITNGSGSELNPVLRSIVGFTSIGLISPSSCIVTISFYK